MPPYLARKLLHIIWLRDPHRSNTVATPCPLRPPSMLMTCFTGDIEEPPSAYQPEAGDNWIDRAEAFQTHTSRVNQYSGVVLLGTFDLRPACELPKSLSATRTAN